MSAELDYFFSLRFRLNAKFEQIQEYKNRLYSRDYDDLDEKEYIKSRIEDITSEMSEIEDEISSLREEVKEELENFDGSF